MGFQVSPGVNVTERDLTTIVPAVATTNAGIVGGFRWGPVNERTLVDSENNLRSVFGDPTDATYNWWFTAANFLSYGNNLQVVRVVGTTSTNANNTSSSGRINNRTQFDGASAGWSLAAAEWVAKYPGEMGNGLEVVVMDDAGRYGTVDGVAVGVPSAHFGISGAASVGDTGITLGFTGTNGTAIDIRKGDRIVFANGEVYTVKQGRMGITLAAATTNITYEPAMISAKAAGATCYLEHRYANQFQSIPSTSSQCEAAGGTNDEMNIAIVDGLGKWTGTVGEVIEKFEGVSKATDARSFDGSANYYKDVINDRSKYIWANIGTLPGVATGDLTSTFAAVTHAATGLTTDYDNPIGQNIRHIGLSGGVSADDYAAGTMTNANLITGLELFEDAETVDVSLLMAGASDSTVQGRMIDICDRRKDCIAFLSPINSSSDPAGLVQNKTAGDAQAAVRNFRNVTLNKSSSYAVLDSGFKVMFDRYNDVMRYVPLNGDIAGLCARTEVEQEAWFSPAGFNRGQIRGVVKLAFEPRQAHRDNLYKDQINPVVSFPGEGTVLFGDKTLQSKPSAFDRINVRRLFIVLEKAIATASKYLLFEFNDEFTRAQFRNMVIPFLRTIMSRRGIYDFKVVCDESNNTGEVIDRNEFVGDIYIKPARSINYIQLNFIATKTGVDFSEVGG